MSLRLTKQLIYAAALDAAKRSAHERGINKMDEQCADAYHAEFKRLFEFVGGPEGWMELPP